MNREISGFLDASRWMAAFTVIISHARHLILVDYPAVPTPTLFMKSVYFVTGLGHEAVVVFFVVSGFLVGGLTLERWKREGPKPMEYATARIARIYTVLIPALLVSMAIDMAGSKWFDDAHLYSDPAAYHTVSLFAPVTGQLDLRTLLGNVMMLQTIAVPVLGSNGPLWSLAYEWWYYCIFFFVGSTVFASTLKWVTVCVAVTVLAAWWLPANVVLLGSLWAVGVVLYFVTRTKWRRIPRFLGIAIFSVAVIWARLSHNANNIDSPETIFASFWRDLVVAVAYSVLLYSFVDAKVNWRFPRLHKALADFSYSAYLVHFPMLIFLVACFNQTFGIGFLKQPSFQGYVYLMSATVLLCSYSRVFAFLTEQHTDWVRDRMRSLARELSARYRGTRTAALADSAPNPK